MKLTIENFQGFFCLRLDNDILGYYTSVIQASDDLAQAASSLGFKEIKCSNKLLEQFTNKILSKKNK